jgi:membrane protein
MSPSRSAAGLPGAVRFVRAVLARFAADRGPSLAASLTYTTLLALVPLLAIALSIMTAFPVFEQFSLATQRFVEENLLPPRVGETVLGYLREFSEGATRLTALGLGALAVSAFFMMHTIETAFNAIWRTRRRRPLGLRILVYWCVVTLGPVLVGASLTSTSYLVTASLGLAAAVPGGQALLLIAAQLALTSVAFTLLYYVVPSRAVAFRHALAGGCAAALLFELVNRAFAFYIGHVSTYTLVYGAFAVVPLFLVWVYIAWSVALLGAEVTALLPGYRYALAGPQAVAAPAVAEVLAVLGALVRAQMSGEPLAASRIAATTPVAVERCDVVLEALARGGWVVQSEDGRWTLACDPDRISVAQVVETTVRPAGGGVQALAVQRLLDRAAARLHEALDVPLRTLGDDAAARPAPAELPRRLRRR